MASCRVDLPAALRDWIRTDSGSSSFRETAARYPTSLLVSSPVMPDGLQVGQDLLEDVRILQEAQGFVLLLLCGICDKVLLFLWPIAIPPGSIICLMSSLISSSDAPKDVHADLGKPLPGPGRVQVNRRQLKGKLAVQVAGGLDRHLKLRVRPLDALRSHRTARRKPTMKP